MNQLVRLHGSTSNITVFRLSFTVPDPLAVLILIDPELSDLENGVKILSEMSEAQILKDLEDADDYPIFTYDFPPEFGDGPLTESITLASLQLTYVKETFFKEKVEKYEN